MTSLMRGRQKWQDRELGKLLSIENAMPAIFELVKRKDYNRIVARLRNYHSLVLFLHSPPINNLSALTQVHSSLSDLEASLRDIELSVDQISDDCHSMGLRDIEDTLQGMMQILKITHDYLNKQVKEGLYSDKAEHFKLKRNSKNLCEECYNTHEAVHLRRLKTSFGCDFPQRDAVDRNKKNELQSEDLALKEKDDFISQLDYLLEKKSSINSLTVNTRRYKELVDVLSKMERMESLVQKKQQKHREKREEEEEEHERDDQQLFGDKYNQVVEEVKKILNLRFREGYSHRIRNMLDKFEIVFKSEHMRVTEKKNLINMVDQEMQTLPTTEGAQLELLKEELASKQVELVGLAEGRKRIQQKYLRLLEAQRKISREANSNASKNEQLVRSLEQKEKSIETLQKKLGITVQRVEYRSNESDRGQYSNRNNTIHRQEDQRRDQQKNVELKDCESQTQHESFDIPPIEHRKKNLRMFKKASFKMTTSKLISSLSEQINQPTLSLFSNLIEISINVTKPIRIKNKNTQPKEKLTEIDENDQPTTSKKKKRSNKSKKGKLPHTNSKKTLHVQSKQGLKYIKSIEQLNKQSQDQVIDELSEGSADSPRQSQQLAKNNRISIDSRSSRFLLPLQRRESRDYQAISSIRLTDMSKTFRLNHLKTDVSRPKDETSMILNNKEKDGSIVRIERYAKKKSSGSVDKDRVREIVNLLKVQREVITKKSNFKPYQQQPPLIGFTQTITDQKSQQSHQIQAEQVVEEREQCEHQNIGETIQSLKIIIESEYSYLKASGFIGFLLSFDRKPSFVNRNLIKYRFQFTHLSESDLDLFGGLEEMIKFSRRVGIWQRYVQDESDLKLYYKHINFAHKVSKYFLLLKKMNPEYFEEYVGFITDPLGFSLAKFGAQIRQQISFYSVQDEQKQIFPSNQSSWKRVMMRLIRYHHDSHKNCKHIVEFLDKIGYYRYSI